MSEGPQRQVARALGIALYRSSWRASIVVASSA
jgi:hypothetical protein